MAEMLREVGLPADVFQVAVGYGDTGAALISEVDCVMFTGSTPTGRIVARAAAEALIPCHLELGGKDPMIICADADVEKAANAAAYYSMNNAGQVCISVERVYVEAPVYEEFVTRVTGKVGALRQGPPAGPGSVDVGAVIFPPQLEIVRDHINDAVEKGATVLVGGHARVEPGAPGGSAQGARDGHAETGAGTGTGTAAAAGRFFEPTVLVGVDHTMETMREETFGPVLPIMKVADVEEAVRLANDSQYGLQASVWTRDRGKGEAIARRLQVGAACVKHRPAQLLRAEPADGWLEGLRPQHPARRRRDPQVLPYAVADGRLRAPPGGLHVPLPGLGDTCARPAVPAAVRARTPRLNGPCRKWSNCYQLVTTRPQLLIVCDSCSRNPHNCVRNLKCQ